MMKIPINMLLSIIVLVAISLVLLVIIGSPNCDDAARKTAYDLKTKIDEVVEYYPYYSGTGVPNDNTYYAESEIKLCQERGVTVWEGFLGSQPQYEIYDERFPESGGGLWTEAYPWSGGAASTLRFWAAMRVATGIFEITNAVLMAKVAQYAGFQEWLGGIGHQIRLAVFGQGFESKAEDVSKIVLQETGVTIAEDSSAYYIIRQYKGAEYLYTMDEALQDGIIDGVEQNGRLVFSNQELDVIIPTAWDADGDPIEHVTLYEKTDSSGKVVDMTTDSTKVFDSSGNFISDSEGTWRNLKVNPSEMYKDWLETLSPEDQKLMQTIYATPDQVDVSTIVKNKIKDSKFYQTFFQPVEDKLDAFVEKIGEVNYKINGGIMGEGSTVGTKLAITDALQDTTVLPNGMEKGDVISDMFLEDPGIKDKIRLGLGLSNDVQIEKEHLIKFLDEFGAKGLGFIPQEMDWGLGQQALDTIIASSKNGISYTGPAAEDAIFRDSFGYDLPTNTIVPGMEDKYNELQQYAKLNGLTEAEARGKALDIITKDIYPNYLGDTVRGANAVQLSRDSFNHYLLGDLGDTTILNGGLVTRYAADPTLYPGVSDEAAKQVELLIGFGEQNKDTLPVTKIGVLGRVVKAEAKKLIYLDGPQNLLNPTGFYAEAIMASRVASGCQGNSICLAVKNNLETPIYLNEETQNFAVKLWRPVTIVQQVLGWQAALMHVPSNPRFYVVSPCFATTKIWKTTYDSKPTIFVEINKAGVGGEASNYCVADTNLINQYVAIWASSDAATVVTTLLGFGVIKGATKMINMVIKVSDPVTLAQGIAEGVVSWPTYPWKPLTYDIMLKYQKELVTTSLTNPSP